MRSRPFFIQCRRCTHTSSIVFQQRRQQYNSKTGTTRGTEDNKTTTGQWETVFDVDYVSDLLCVFICIDSRDLHGDVDGGNPAESAEIHGNGYCIVVYTGCD